MAKIINTYRQPLPALRFIGERYGEEDRVNGSYAAMWQEWFQNGWFQRIEEALGDAYQNVYEDSDAYIGLMHGKESGPFQYWIGLFAPANAVVPEGFEYLDLPAGNASVCWVQGKENTGEVYGQENACMERLSRDGLPAHPASDGAWWCFERYACPRFTTPNEQGEIILDIGFLTDL